MKNSEKKPTASGIWKEQMRNKHLYHWWNFATLYLQIKKTRERIYKYTWGYGSRGDETLTSFLNRVIREVGIKNLSEEDFWGYAECVSDWKNRNYAVTVAEAKKKGVKVCRY